MKKRLIGMLLVCAILCSSTFAFSATTVTPGKSNTLTRSQFATMLYKALDIHINYFVAPDITKTFNDVKQEASYASALIDLVTTGIVDDKLSFRPDDVILKEEMIHYLMNAYRYKMGEKYLDPAGFNLVVFKDTMKITPKYIVDVALAAHFGLITGNRSTYFYPKSTIDQENAEAFISTLLKLLGIEQKTDIAVEPSATVNQDSIDMKLTITNNSSKAVTINYRDGQKFDFVLLDANRQELYRWSEGMFFIMALTSTTIDAGSKVEYSVSLKDEEYAKIKDKMVYMRAYITGSSEDFSINAGGYEIKLG